MTPERVGRWRCALRPWPKWVRGTFGDAMEHYYREHEGEGRVMATWRKLIDIEMAKHGERWDSLHWVVMPPQPEPGAWGDPEFVSDLDAEFDAGYGGINGCPFTVWTKRWVYFPVVYDGAESVGSVPRDPCDVATEHVGGW